MLRSRLGASSRMALASLGRPANATPLRAPLLLATFSASARRHLSLPAINEALSASNIPTSQLPPSQQPGAAKELPKHAVISTFDLFSVGIGPSSSHTVGPQRAAKIFTHSLPRAMFDDIHSLKVSLHGSLAATGMGHMTPHAVLLGLMGEDPETVEVGRLNVVIDEVRAVGQIDLGLDGGEHRRVRFDFDKDLTWHLNPLPTHPNGMTFTVFDKDGDMLATNQYFSIGGGFVINNETQVAENMYYRDILTGHADECRRGLSTSRGEPIVAITDKGTDGPGTEAALSHRPKYLFATAEELHNICVEHNMTIAQVMWENERAFRNEADIEAGLLHLWATMDSCIRAGVTTTETHLPGGLNVKRRAPGLYRRLQQGFYPSVPAPVSNADDTGTSITKRGPPPRIGRVDHPVEIVPVTARPHFPGIEYLSCMAIAVNEVNASGGRVVTAPTNGAAGVIPSTLKYTLEFISTQPRRDTMNFLLTASAIGMLFKRGATISAAEGGCMAEVGVACSMAAAGLASILGAEPATILQAAEIGIEHNLGLTCDPLGGLVQIPCIERNSLGAVKAVTAAQLAMATSGEHTVSLDDAIEACRTTAMDMHSHYKETSLGGLAASVQIPLSSPAC